MGLRDDLVSRLIRSLMGPEHGQLEVLAADRSPRDQYITGVLAPRPDPAAPPPAAPAHDIDADADTLEGDVDSDEDDDDPGVITASTGVSPALDPRSLPCSIGITFVVEAPGTPELNICATYARYLEREDDQWQRQPHSKVTGFIPATDGWTDQGPGQAELRVRRVAVPGNPLLHRVSVFLINVAPPPPADQAPPVQDLIFQPQIRICLAPESSLKSLLRGRSHEQAQSDPDADEEEDSLELLYRDRPVLARGHMCAAVWRDIDPECPAASGETSPFRWVDEEAVTVTERERFRHPDLRTEMIPMLPVSAPDISWAADRGPGPERDPAVLAELWDAGQLAAALQPLVDAYSTWIANTFQQSHLDALPPQLQAAAHRHRGLCEATRDRLQDAITLLVENEQVRLAFCFANRAIALQAGWRGSAITWHPFQLAFILLCLRGIAEGSHQDRGICDLLWFATGGGKTEAYLGLSAFTLGLRRLRAGGDQQGHRGDTGLGVISRYTLRLLTIQQFRRALGVITACELLRIAPASGGVTGWRPAACGIRDDHLWGTARFSAGLWVGSGVTPNHMHPIGWPDTIPGALDILRATTPPVGHGEPAQVLRCPCCRTHLAIAQPRHDRQERPAFPPGHEDHLSFVFYSQDPVPALNPAGLSDARLEVLDAGVTPLAAAGFYILSVSFRARGEGASARDIDRWWDTTVLPQLPPWSRIESARASRPGYFLRTFRTQQNRDKEYDFEIYCPSVRCGLAGHAWREKVPVPVQLRTAGPLDRDWQQVIAPFQSAADPLLGTRIPIPAITVDGQVYAHPPSLLVATVDKFARLPYEPRAASLFGHVTHYHAREGYYRERCPGGPPVPGQNHPPVQALSRAVARFRPPDLILQDELHLIDGPLGSMVGLYETAIDALAEDRSGREVVRPKYIASTATVRHASEQVQGLFCRELAQFPPPGLSSGDNFFAITTEAHPVRDEPPGRLYLGVSAPAKGAQTPIIRIWAVLLQAAYEARQAGVSIAELDGFWTLVGYFNAVRELAGAMTLYRQDIPQRISHIASGSPRRELKEPVELSSRADSLQLPALLSSLEVSLPQDAEDAVLATSMFGTGVDITRLGLMVVQGQPKTTSSYIQATGRVGRQRGGLVVTFFRASRPRDLDHYEFFTGYHRQLYRAVEPVTVAPFSPRARERALGPLCVALLRHAAQVSGQPVHPEWRREQRNSTGMATGCQRMVTARTSAEVVALSALFEERAQAQPDGRCPDPGRTFDECNSELDRWRNLAQMYQGVTGLLYNEYAITSAPTHAVVLGDAQHQRRQFDVAFEDAPQSLRDVEPTTGFKV